MLSMMQTESLLNCDLSFVRETIEKTAVDMILARSRVRPIAIVMGGSFARLEETVLVQNGSATVIGDAELYAVFKTPSDTKLFLNIAHLLAEEIQQQLATREIHCPVSFGVPSCRILRCMPPHIMGFELRTTGKVLWGDYDILTLIPPFGPKDIPKWDAWRSVANRMIEQLVYADALRSEGAGGVSKLLYSCLKIQLELATMVLHFLGAYQPTYQQRAEALKQLEKHSDHREFPWLSELTTRVEACTYFKLDPNKSSPYGEIFRGACPEVDQHRIVEEECLRVMELVRSVWVWGAERLLKCKLDESVDPLNIALRLAHAQDWRWRLRGWLRLGLLEAGWRNSDFWFSVARLANYGSPRFLTYGVAATLYFNWGGWLDIRSSMPDEAAQRAMRYFPFGRMRANKVTTWLEASRVVVSGWDRFLKTSWV